MAVLGLDIGGANVKAAHSAGVARTVPFALWKDPSQLPGVLQTLLASLPAADVLAVTMTGELCDCFASKTDGVLSILDAVSQVGGSRNVKVWTTRRSFIDIHQARAEPLSVAAANWLALATWAAKLVAPKPGLLIDIGSTTTDIVPLLGGLPQPHGWTDPARLQTKEMVYCGVRRTPLCALLGLSAAAEWFATTLDVYLTLGMIPEDASDTDTADHRPATCLAAHARLAHMLCGDAETVSMAETRFLAQHAMEIQLASLARAVQDISSRMTDKPQSIVVAGSGEFLALELLGHGECAVVSLAETWGPELSTAACAYAVSQLATM